MKNPPAFPVVGMSQIGQQPVTAVFDSGMSLRDYFAAMAMQAMLSSQECPLDAMTEIPKAAYVIASTMLKERDATT